VRAQCEKKVLPDSAVDDVRSTKLEAAIVRLVDITRSLDVQEFPYLNYPVGDPIHHFGIMAEYFSETRAATSMASPHHADAIMNPAYVKMGVGVAEYVGLTPDTDFELGIGLFNPETGTYTTEPTTVNFDPVPGTKLIYFVWFSQE